MKPVLYLLLVVSLVGYSSRGNAQNDEGWNSRTYTVTPFSRIYLEGGYRVYLFQSDQPSLKIKAADDEVFEDLEVNSSEESLKLSVRKKHFNFDRLTLYIGFKNLEELYVSGGAKLTTKGYIDVKNLYVRVEGGAKIEMDVKASAIKLDCNGAMLFDLEGVADRLDVQVSGAAHIDAEDLKAKEVSFRVEGVGTGSVHALNHLRVNIQGVGKVSYRGEPQVSKTIDGIGSVTRD